MGQNSSSSHSALLEQAQKASGRYSSLKQNMIKRKKEIKSESNAQNARVKWMKEKERLDVEMRRFSTLVSAAWDRAAACSYEKPSLDERLFSDIDVRNEMETLRRTKEEISTHIAIEKQGLIGMLLDVLSATKSLKKVYGISSTIYDSSTQDRDNCITGSRKHSEWAVSLSADLLLRIRQELENAQTALQEDLSLVKAEISDSKFEIQEVIKGPINIKNDDPAMSFDSIRGKLLEEPVFGDISEKQNILYLESVQRALTMMKKDQLETFKVAKQQSQDMRAELQACEDKKLKEHESHQAELMRERCAKSKQVSMVYLKNKREESERLKLLESEKKLKEQKEAKYQFRHNQER